MKKYVTIVYEIVDDDAWGHGGNPLGYKHHGLQAVGVSIGDRVGMLHEIEALADRGDHIDRELFDELDRRYRT